MKGKANNVKKNKKNNTRIVIWEDWQGRQIPIPAGDMALYCTGKKSGNYHTTDQCGAIRGKRCETLTYRQLADEDYQKLKPCALCAAPLPPLEIMKINMTYAAGGDHDPVMTEARKSCPRSLKGR